MDLVLLAGRTRACEFLQVAAHVTNGAQLSFLMGLWPRHQIAQEKDISMLEANERKELGSRFGNTWGKASFLNEVIQELFFEISIKDQ